MAIDPALINKLANAIAEKLVDLLPVAFLIHDEDMELLIKLLPLVKKGHTVTDDERQHIDDVIRHVWKACKPLTDKDMDRLLRGLDMIEAQEQADKETKQ